MSKISFRVDSEEAEEAWLTEPLTPVEANLEEIADWGPAEDWTDWTEEAR